MFRRAALVALITAGVGVVFAGPAIAHEPLVTGEVVCSADGEHVLVTWHLKNSETVTGTNRSMVVISAVLSEGTLTGISAGTTAAPQPLPGSTVNGSTTLPSTATGSDVLTVHVRWVDLLGQPAGPQDVAGTATVILPADCPHPTTTVPPTTTTTQATTTTTQASTTTTQRATTTTAVPRAAVLGVSITQPPAPVAAAALPRTGAPIDRSLLFAATALLLGMIATLAKTLMPARR